jgi:hypothetical protein
MLSQHEESQILRGIDEIMYNLRHVPSEDVAHFLVKFNPKLAEELVAALEYEIFDKNEGIKHE